MKAETNMENNIEIKNIREKTPTLYIVIPCYNEEEVLPITSKQFLAKIRQLVTEEKITDDSRILFVNDGSKVQHGILSGNSQQKIRIILESARAGTEDIRMLYWQVLWKQKTSVILQFRLIATDKMILTPWIVW